MAITEIGPKIEKEDEREGMSDTRITTQKIPFRYQTADKLANNCCSQVVVLYHIDQRSLLHAYCPESSLNNNNKGEKERKKNIINPSKWIIIR